MVVYLCFRLLNAFNKAGGFCLQFVFSTMAWASCRACVITIQLIDKCLPSATSYTQCSTLMVARLPGATKNFNWAGKFSTVVAWSGNHELHLLLHLNSPPTFIVNVFKIKKYHDTIMAKIAMLEIRSFVDHKLAVFTYFKRNFSPYTSQRCDQQKLSNLACSVKQRTGCENGTTRMLSAGQQTSESIGFSVWQTAEK